MKNNEEVNKFERQAEIFKALSNPVRLEVIDVLLDGEKCVCEIIEKLNKYEQPHISKSLAKLQKGSLIESRKEGLKVFYKLRCECIGEFIKCINNII